MSTLQAKNETIIDAPIERLWAVITDINSLHKVNPGVIKAAGRMDIQGETRTCEIDNKGRKGTMVERLIELIPQKKTVWTIEHDTMGMGKMLADTRFVFNLEKLGENQTRVTNETYYKPASYIARIINGLIMKRMISKAQEQILSNLRSLTENKPHGNTTQRDYN
ncbi:MAG TPA: SRPBCC family protein [Cyclobacteriaceae bacterium]